MLKALTDLIHPGNTNMSSRYMFSVELKAGSKTEFTWDSNLLSTLIAKEGPIVETFAHTLIINQVIVGPSAKENEVNVVHVEVTDPAVKEAVSFPLAYVVQGKQCHQKVDFTFPETVQPDLKVKFTLEGNGPVHIVGYHMTVEVDGDANPTSDESDDEAEVEEDEEEMDDDEMEEMGAKPTLAAKRRLESEQNGGSKAKKIKTTEDDEKNSNKNGGTEDKEKKSEDAAETKEKEEVKA